MTKLEQETQISLEKWDAADNIDLFMIFKEYEQYYEARFSKLPKVVKKVEDKSTYEQLRKNALRQKQLNDSINKTGVGKEPEKPSVPPSNKRISDLNELTSREENHRTTINKKIRRARRTLSKNLQNFKSRAAL